MQNYSEIDLNPRWIDATGDVVAGDTVRFKRAIFGGSHRRPVFLGHEDIEGVVLRDSYGLRTGQHTFTLRTPDRDLKIMGRNLYRNGVSRQIWHDESARRLAADEKHRRGDFARNERAEKMFGPAR